jgi:hypothetical protein
MDRGYLNYKRLSDPNQAPAFFVFRSNVNTDLRPFYSMPVGQESEVLF